MTDQKHTDDPTLIRDTDPIEGGVLVWFPCDVEGDYCLPRSVVAWNCVPVFGPTTSKDGEPWPDMPWLDSEDMEQYCRWRPPPDAKISEYADTSLGVPFDLVWRQKCRHHVCVVACDSGEGNCWCDKDGANNDSRKRLTATADKTTQAKRFLERDVHWIDHLGKIHKVEPVEYGSGMNKQGLLMEHPEFATAVFVEIAAMTKAKTAVIARAKRCLRENPFCPACNAYKETRAELRDGFAHAVWWCGCEEEGR